MTTNTAQSEALVLLTTRQVCLATGLSRSTLYRLIAKKQFPPARSLPHGRICRWSRSDIEAWAAALTQHQPK